MSRNPQESVTYAVVPAYLAIPYISGSPYLDVFGDGSQEAL